MMEIFICIYLGLRTILFLTVFALLLPLRIQILTTFKNMFKDTQKHNVSPTIASKQHLHHFQNGFQQQNQLTTNSANQLVSQTLQQNKLQSGYGIYFK